MIKERVAEERSLLRLWTSAEFERLGAAGLFDPDERLELLDGEIFQMTPQSSRHATTVSKLTRMAFEIFGASYVIRVQLPLVVATQSLLEPDLAIVSGVEDDYRDAHPTTAVFVAEVADSSLARDKDLKQRLYARAGIPEYWLINLIDECLEVFRNPARERYQYHLILGSAESIALLTHLDQPLSVSDLLP